MSERTLTRRLAEEGVTFNEVLQQLKASLATRYLEEDGMPISRIAWLLGFEGALSVTPVGGGLASRPANFDVHFDFFGRRIARRRRLSTNEKSAFNRSSIRF
jgi:Helix-turn-helix domain